MKIDERATAAMNERFLVHCKACNSTEIVIENDIRQADDGGGYVDRWGDVTMRCKACGKSALIFEA